MDSSEPERFGAIALDLLERLAEGCQIIGPDFRYVYLNNAAAAHGQRPKAELLGRTMMECYPGIQHTEVFDVLRRCLAERTHALMENEFRYPDGSLGWFELRFIPVSMGVCILSLDVSERMRAMESLRQSERLFHELHDAMPEAVLLVGNDGRILVANEVANRMFQRALVGQLVDELVPAARRAGHAQHRRDFAESPRTLSMGIGRDITGVRADGSEFPVDVSLAPCSHAGGPAVLAVVRDMTERAMVDERLRQGQRLEALGRLAGGVAHDFNNLLSVILGYSGILLDETRAGDPRREELAAIHSAGTRAAELTKQLLAFGRRQVLRPAPLDLNEIVRPLAPILRRLLREDIELNLRLGHGLGFVDVDPSQLEQIVMNLVVNARDAMPRGGKLTIETIDVHLDVSYAAEHAEVTAGPHVMVAITDTGVGMDKATQNRMFEPFFTTKEQSKGTGLGLATVFGAVRQSGGHIWVYSEIGKGTTIKVYFPRSGAETAHVTAPPAPSPAGRATETILLVEDDESVRALVRVILGRLGYHVLEAQSGGDALLICEQHGATIHLLLTDVVMPRMSGRELADRLKPLRPSMKVLYMSGYTENSIVHHGVLDSGIALLPKPIMPDELARKLREVLDG